MSYDQYVDWYDRQAGRRGEWVDGEVIVFVSATYLHERILAYIIALLSNIVVEFGLGEVLGDEYEVRTREGAIRLPDVKVVLNEHRDRITARRLVGAADLVVEVISPDSVTRDHEVKLEEYAASGIPEYWVIDPREGRERVDLFVLDSTGRYAATRPDQEGRFHSTVVPGFWVDPRWLTVDQLPGPVSVATRMARSAGLVGDGE